MFNNSFPFSAVLGQDRIKRALVLNLINPNIGGVIISGEKGTGKSTLVRGLANILDDMNVIHLPLNITEDRLVGSMDIKKAIKSGQKIFEKGILYKAHRQILYVDEINLLSKHITNILLEVLSTGENVVEREGISYRHPSQFILIGSMNPEEGTLRPQLLDKFGLYVEAKSNMAVEDRVNIIKRRLDYEENPSEFCLKWEIENRKLGKLIHHCRQRIEDVKLERENLIYAAELVTYGNCMGNRAEVILTETAKAIATLKKRNYITREDIEEAATYVLPHRIKDTITIEEKKESFEDGKEQDSFEEEDRAEAMENFNANEKSSRENKDTQTKTEEQETSVEDIKPMDEDISLNIGSGKKYNNQGSGKRNKVKTDEHKGRYVKYRIPKSFPKDIAFDATFRIAAVNQKNREKKDLAINIKLQDIREKVREKRTGATILFVVDVSGSMGARRRMGAVKGAVLSLLNNAYQKRDRIGIIAFRKDQAKVLLDITKSVDLAEKCLRKLPTGGRTPLASGLYSGYQILKVDKIKNPDSLQYLVLVSDGKANVALKTENPLEDAFVIGEMIKNEDIKTMVIDTEKNYIEYGFAKQLSEKMGSQYIKISQISKTDVETSVKNLLNINK